MVMSGWSCLVVWLCQMLCLFWDIFREYIRLAQATKTSLRPFWTSFVCLGTYSMNIRLTIKNSHTTLRCREYFDWTQLSHLQQLQSQNLNNSHTFSNFCDSATSITEPQQLSYLQQLQSQNLSQQLSQKLINSHTYLAAKHCSSHSHTISAVHLHNIMSGKGLLTL